MVNHSVLNHVFMLANSQETHEEVKARTYSTLKQLKKQLDKKYPEEYHYQYLSEKIDKFLSGEIDIQYPDQLKAPDGSPIGAHDHLLFSCESEL